MLTEAKRAKLNQFTAAFIEYPILTTIISDFETLRSYYDLTGEKPCMVLCGDAGCGKSAVIEHYYQRNLPHFSDGRRKVPVLLSRISDSPSIESTLKLLLHDLGQFGAKIGKRLKNNDDIALTESLIEQLKLSGTELIIIDDFQRLVNCSLGRRCREIAHKLKYINERAGISIVLVGMPSIVQLVSEPQWSSRILIRRFIPYFKLSEDPKSFIRLLMGLANRLPFTEKPNFAQEEIALALFAISSGSFRELKNFLNLALQNALKDGSRTFERQYLSCAFSTLWPELPNVFEMKANEIKGCEVEQYSTFKPDGPHDEDPFIDTQFCKKVPLVQLLKK
ncbi:TniB family NTP-binding protein [Pseudoalteromonas piscicida]|uniref:TniB family NTP-binding protein n=1 Tax=Pseudoalteromonas piscicida TaxID=43662 RepID=UPI002739135F|nr:TniB family NTP-binding protein [Pseudoalteromonas piscicida]MDP4487672.1 TniB family NTP-binding protein [Pseudoalteromonas piscicida]